MAKYRVYGIMTASNLIGVYEAESGEEAIKKAENDGQGNWNPTICHQCSDEIELGEIYKTEAEED